MSNWNFTLNVSNTKSDSGVKIWNLGQTNIRSFWGHFIHDFGNFQHAAGSSLVLGYIHNSMRFDEKKEKNGYYDNFKMKFKSNIDRRLGNSILSWLLTILGRYLAFFFYKQAFNFQILFFFIFMFSQLVHIYFCFLINANLIFH